MWPNLQIPADLVTFSEEVLNRKLHFLWNAEKGQEEPVVHPILIEQVLEKLRLLNRGQQSFEIYLGRLSSHLVSEITFLVQNSTRPFSSLPNSLHKLCQWEEPQH